MVSHGSRLLHDGAITEDAQVTTSPQISQLPKFPRLCIFGQIWFARFPKTEIYRPDFLHSAIIRRLDTFGWITRRDNLHVGNCARDGDVLLRVVRATERRVDETCAHPDYCYRKSLVTEVIAHEFERPIEAECRYRVGKWLFAAKGEASANANHSLFGNSCINKSVRIFCAKIIHAAGRRDVGDYDVDVRIINGAAIKRFGESVSHASSSAIALAYSLFDGDL